MKSLIPKHRELALLLVRVGVGVTFLMHGIAKLQNMEGTIGFFNSIGFGAAEAWFVAILETVGGAFILLGLGMEIVGLLLAIVMLVVIFKLKLKGGFLGPMGIELEFILLMSSLSLVFSKPGAWSLDNLLCGPKKTAAAPAQPTMQ
jgi:uncharacterized membrane protein YphA (DoxX/SURF4 family)